MYEFLITSLVPSNCTCLFFSFYHCIVCPSSNDGFWLPFLSSNCSCLFSSGHCIFLLRFTASDYPFGTIRHFCIFFVVHCIVCPSIYGFWLPIWYLQTFAFFSFGHCIVSSLIFANVSCHWKKLKRIEYNFFYKS
jgi:hypothetical protein